MRAPSIDLRRSRFAIGLVSIALLAGPVALSTPADAVVAAPVCLAGSGTPTAARGPADTPAVSKAVKEQVAAEMASTLSTARARAARTGAAPLPAKIRIWVRIHVIHGRHKADRKITRTGARRMFYTLRGAFNGRQNSSMTPTGIEFQLHSITISRNDKWFHARPGSAADKQMKRKLHRGKRQVLNIYLNNEKSAGQALLGFARFPWLAGRYPKLDGVTINVETLPGGRARGYNLGDTVVHETGHWLGLLHTFEGGCEAPGDYVADTAPEGQPSFACDKTRDTCPTELPPDYLPGQPLPEPVPDPVTNFMDYSYDSCMNHFTPGQRTRMVASFMRYRAGR
ncbi:zinc metalloprotease [Nocardioides marmoriginsengisoli]|uniref:Zinc metalloprotease n=1 Tax=Nocardioides marmoriginsengisoli TaxID=661483 RepID=A0A3N0CI17_9ACTN|nr:zinc metalloprotease [Nocardioides marmoriginsengisoli]RNL63118.1 zinc metalloprotease [Nocardioides marmoriginsengisoli]